MELKKQLFPKLLIFSIFIFSCSSDEIPHVKTLLGGINGFFKVSAENRKFAAFEGIPYALPPNGERRFKPPERFPAWSGNINATKLQKGCTQYYSLSFSERKTMGEEDCLYMNIYTPAESQNDNLPVIFWIHGGGFQYGTGAEDGPKFLMDKSLILVTFNYRVGPFGFLSTGDDVVPGNMGLKDQSMALRWVSENIKYFGGDPKRITLTGVSAGGASVHYHYLSPMSAGLFHNGISFSGTALARWAYLSDSSSRTKILANALKCPTDCSVAMIQCLRRISAHDIVTTVKDLLSDLYFSYVYFTPVPEKSNGDYFINDSPKNIIESGRAYDVPWIAGIVSEEGLYITAGFGLNQTMMTYTEKNWRTIAPYMLHYQNNIPDCKQSLLVDLAKKHYLGDKPLTTDRKTIKALTHLAGDDQIVTSTIRAVKLQAKINKNPVRLYYYSYRASQSFSDYLSKTTENLGVSHDDDVSIVLENDYINPTTTEKDRRMLQDMLKFWDSYARNGIPNLGTEWPGINAATGNIEYMHIAGPGNFTMEINNNLGEIQFWQRIGL